MVYVQLDKPTVIVGNRRCIGNRHSDVNCQFTDPTVGIEAGMTFYLFSDGIIDQLGGEKEFPFCNRRFRKLWVEISREPFVKQEKAILHAFNTYKGDNDRRDDIKVMGFGLDARLIRNDVAQDQRKPSRNIANVSR
ncbi:MAG: hypothetical protein GY866_28105 [Proteobacteria bacterium]|nr:hypothetical protein [Pseudomonadota bacterium]